MDKEESFEEYKRKTVNKLLIKSGLGLQPGEDVDELFENNISHAQVFNDQHDKYEKLLAEKDEQLKEARKHISFLFNALENFQPFRDGKNLSPHMSKMAYQTLSYSGDKRLVDMHLAAEQWLEQFKESE